MDSVIIKIRGDLEVSRCMNAADGFEYIECVIRSAIKNKLNITATSHRLDGSHAVEWIIKNGEVIA